MVITDYIDLLLKSLKTNNRKNIEYFNKTENSFTTIFEFDKIYISKIHQKLLNECKKRYSQQTFELMFKLHSVTLNFKLTQICNHKVAKMKSYNQKAIKPKTEYIYDCKDCMYFQYNYCIQGLHNIDILGCRMQLYLIEQSTFIFNSFIYASNIIESNLFLFW